MENTPAAAPAAPVATVSTDNPYGPCPLCGRLPETSSRARCSFLLLPSCRSPPGTSSSRSCGTERKLRQSARAVEKQFWNAPSVKDGVERLKKGDEFRGIAEDGLRAASHHDGAPDGPHRSERMDHDVAAARRGRRQQQALQRGWGLLATVGSTAPFVGLFGTVVGHPERAGGHRYRRPGEHRQGCRTGRRGVDHDGDRPVRWRCRRSWATTGSSAARRACRTRCGTLRATCMPIW